MRFRLADLIERCPALADGACRCLISAGDKKAAAILIPLRNIVPDRARLAVDATIAVLSPDNPIIANQFAEFRRVTNLHKEGHRPPEEVADRFQWLCFLAANTWNVELTRQLMEAIDSQQDAQLRTDMLGSFIDETRAVGLLMVLGLADLPEEQLRVFLAKDPERLRSVAIQLSPDLYDPKMPAKMKDSVREAQNRLHTMVVEIRRQKSVPGATDAKEK